MRKIYAKAIEMVNPVTLQEKLVTIVEKLVTIVEKIDGSNYAERLIDVLFDADIKEEELPSVVKCYDEIRTRKSFDYLNDKVEYDYERTDTRYFINKSDAVKYSKSGTYDYNTSKNAPRDGYPYEGKYLVTSSSYCNLYEWMNSKVIEK